MFVHPDDTQHGTYTTSILTQSGTVAAWKGNAHGLPKNKTYSLSGSMLVDGKADATYRQAPRNVKGGGLSLADGEACFRPGATLTWTVAITNTAQTKVIDDAPASIVTT